MSVVLGLHLQSDRVLAAVGPDGSAGESRQVFPASLRWPADTAPTLPDRRNHDAIYRHFVDHIGDPRPLSVPGAPDRLADDLAATLIATVVAAVESSRHEHVSRVLIAHPTYWTVAQLSSFHTSLVGAGLGENRALLLAPDIDVALGWIDHTKDSSARNRFRCAICVPRARSSAMPDGRARVISRLSPHTAIPVSACPASTSVSDAVSWPDRPAPAARYRAIRPCSPKCVQSAPRLETRCIPVRFEWRSRRPARVASKSTT
ncbi:hypothetical protein [Gordonia sp. ABSL49_1]|uniref:hypothetical protein n=1 Tax=Gordonia sp. ABSL49_1 TaxID=2920941 RepID=UPI001F0DF6E6|nr:hypothetical protein [Gordonia sp. ABSL49_1]MCH5644424.1 hypothetical protein [Gordonia sp. ABSL49_1]